MARTCHHIRLWNRSSVAGQTFQYRIGAIGPLPGCDSWKWKIYHVVMRRATRQIRRISGSGSVDLLHWGNVSSTWRRCACGVTSSALQTPPMSCKGDPAILILRADKCRVTVSVSCLWFWLAVSFAPAVSAHLGCLEIRRIILNGKDCWGYGRRFGKAILVRHQDVWRKILSGVPTLTSFRRVPRRAHTET